MSVKLNLWLLPALLLSLNVSAVPWKSHLRISHNTKAEIHAYVSSGYDFYTPIDYVAIPQKGYDLPFTFYDENSEIQFVVDYYDSKVSPRILTTNTACLIEVERVNGDRARNIKISIIPVSHRYKCEMISSQEVRVHKEK